MPYRKEFEDLDKVEIVTDILALNRDNMLIAKEAEVKARGDLVMCVESFTDLDVHGSEVFIGKVYYRKKGRA